MVDRIVFLGTSGAIPTENANLPAVLIQFRGKQFLFDCGEDLQRHFVKAGFKLNKPLKIFISHMHADHVIGLPGLLFRLGFSDRNKLVEIFGPAGLIDYFSCHQRTLGLNPPFPLHIAEIHPRQEKIVHFWKEGKKITVEETEIVNRTVYNSKEFLVKYGMGDHNIPDFIFGLFQKPRRGKFSPEIARELGIPEGRLWKKLHEGESIEHDGKVIDPMKTGIVGQARPGKVICYSGDTRPLIQRYIEMFKDLSFAVEYDQIDVLIHEAMFTSEHEDQAHEKGHSTSQDVAQMAHELSKNITVNLLVLTHLSSRYKDTDTFLVEAQSYFKGNLKVAQDFLEIPL